MKSLKQSLIIILVGATLALFLFAFATSQSSRTMPSGITAKGGVDPTNLADELWSTFEAVVEVWKSHGAPAPVITSTNDGRHRGSGRPGTDCSTVTKCRETSDSKHYTNEAYDLRANNVSNNLQRKLAADLQERLGDNYDVEAEFFPRNPANDHIHVEYDPD